MELKKSCLNTWVRDFLRVINISDSLIHSRLRHVLRHVLLSGLNFVVKHKDLSQLFPIIDVCLANPEATVRANIDDFTFLHPHNINVLIRTARTLQVAVRGTGTSFAITRDKKAIGIWRGGRTVAGLNTTNLQLRPARGLDLDEFKIRVRRLQKHNNSRQMNTILGAYGMDLDKLFDDAEEWFDHGC